MPNLIRYWQPELWAIYCHPRRIRVRRVVCAYIIVYRCAFLFERMGVVMRQGLYSHTNMHSVFSVIYFYFIKNDVNAYYYLISPRCYEEDVCTNFYSSLRTCFVLQFVWTGLGSYHH